MFPENTWSGFEDKADDDEQDLKVCGITRKEHLIRLNTAAFLWHLLLSFILLGTLAFLEGKESDAWQRNWGLGFCAFGYISLLISIIVKCTDSENSPVVPFSVSFLLIFLIGIIFLCLFVQTNRRVFPLLLSTSYNHPPVIPPPFDSEIINFTNFPPSYTNSSSCKSGVYAPEEFADWFRCIRLSNWRDEIRRNPDFIESEGRLFPKGNWVLFEPFETTIYLWWGVVFFCLTTALFHLILLWGAYAGGDRCILRKCAVPYWGWIKEGRQPLRWAEYSITASVMIVLILSINRVTDVYQLIYSFILMELINSFGAGIDYTNSPIICIWFWVCSGSAFVWQWILVFNSYFQTIKPYVERRENFTADLLWQQLFNFITPLNWAILISFSSFAVVNIIHQYFRFKGCFDRRCTLQKEVTGDDKTNLMFRAEVAYVVLSFVSKGLLVIIVSAAASTQQ